MADSIPLVRTAAPFAKREGSAGSNGLVCALLWALCSFLDRPAGPRSGSLIPMLGPTRALLRLFALLSPALCLLAVAARAEGVLVTDRWAEARAALEAGETASALSRLEREGAPLGLVAEARGGSGDVEGARAALTAAVGAGPEVVTAAAQLRLARLGGEGAKARWLALLSEPLVREEPLLLDEALLALAGKAEPKEVLSSLGQATPSALVAPAPRAARRREALARALLAIAEAAKASGDEGAWARALKRLWLELPEAKAAKGALERADGELREELSKPEAVLERARVLSTRHDNAAVLKTLAPLRPKAKDTSARACEVRYLAGKAARKMRRYKRARRELDFVAARCEDPFRKKARYLAARVASFGAPNLALPVLAAFLEAYPEDDLSDDVLVWQAELYERLGRLDEGVLAYRRVIAEHPGGDMFHKARFGLALLHARRGDTSGARAVLDELARTALKASPLVRDQALYWRARLLAFPRFDSLTPTADKEELEAGLTALSSLAAARPASFYGHLAGLLAREGAARPLLETAPSQAQLGATSGPLRAALATDRLEPSARLAARPELSAASALLEAGFDAEAALWLDRIDTTTLPEQDRLLVTLLYDRARARERSHQVMRQGGDALLEGQPAGVSLLSWSLSFPRAHAAAIEGAARAAGLAPALLFGLAREESAFEAEVVSWAGALGLCQLMPFTAREEAERLKVPLSSLDALLAPALNARLGAAHLARRMSLGHPLLAIAAYNAGPGNVNKWRKALKFTPVDAFVESIPVEQTRNYVKKVTGSWVVYTALDGGPEAAFPMTLP